VSSPGGSEVARISVRVLPDTAGFAQKLKADLSKINAEVTAEVKFNLNEAELYSKLAALKVPTITVPVDLEKIQDLTLNLDVDTTKATAQVNAFVQKVNAKSATIKINAQIDQAILATQLTKLTSTLAGKRIPIGVDIDKKTLTAGLNSAAAQAATFFKNKKTTITVDVDTKTLGSKMSSAANTVGKAWELLGRGIDTMLGGVFTNVATLGSAAGDKIAGSFDGVTAGMGRLTTAMGPLMGSLVGILFTVPALAAELFKVSAMATLISVAGAGITAAWGLVSTAIAAVPAAIGLIGAPIAAVMLGMDGIKKAAVALKPEFDRLKASVSATFEKGFTKIFTQLKGQMDALTPAINAVATSLLSVAQKTADWITKAEGAKQIQTMFTNIATAIKGINLVPLLDGFTKLAGNQAALDAVVSVINNIGTAMQSIASNTSLNEAFKGLGEVTNSLLQGLTDLVNNGITLFANAWPGMKAGLDGITAFFNKFNWAALGDAVGGVFRGIGTALASIPQSTVDAIVRSFQNLAATFQSAEFQAGIQGFASAMPALITALDLGVRAFGWFGEAIGWAVDKLVPVGATLVAIGGLLGGGFGTAIKTAGQAFIDMGSSAKGAVAPLPNVFTQGLGPLPGIAGAAGQGVATAFTGPLYGVAPGAATALSPTKDAVVQALAQSAASAGIASKKIPEIVGKQIGETPKVVKEILDKVPLITGTALTPTPAAASAAVNPTGQAVAKALAVLDPEAKLAAGKVPVTVGKELTATAGAASTALGTVPAAGTSAFDQLGATPGPGMDAMKTAVDAGLQGVATALGTTLAGLPAVVTQAFTTMQQAATTGVGLIGIGIQAGMPGVTAVLTTAFTALGTTALIPAFTAMQQAATTGVGLIGIGIQAGMPGLTTVILTAFTSLGTLAVLPAFTAIATTIIPQGMTLIGTAVTTAITTTLVPAFTTGLATIGTAITTWTAALPPLFTTAFATINTATIAAFTLMNTTIVTQLALITTTLTNWTLATGLLFTTMWTNINLGVVTAFTLLNTTIIAQLAIITTTVTTWIAAFSLLFTNMWLALNLGTVTAFTTLNTTILAQTAIINTTVTTWIAAFQLLFTNLWTTIQEGWTKGWADMNTATTEGTAAVLATVTQMNTDILAELQTLIDQMATVGDNITTALANAITAGQSKVVNAIVAMVAAALAAAFGALGINSPSKEFQYIGSSIPEGTAKGVDDNVSMVVKSVDSMANAAIDAGSNIWIPGPTIGGAQMDATTKAATANALESASATVPTRAQASANTFNISALPSATAVQLGNEVTFRTTYARQGVHSGR